MLTQQDFERQEQEIKVLTETVEALRAEVKDLRKTLKVTLGREFVVAVNEIKRFAMELCDESLFINQLHLKNEFGEREVGIKLTTAFFRLVLSDLARDYPEKYLLIDEGYGHYVLLNKANAIK